MSDKEEAPPRFRGVSKVPYADMGPEPGKWAAQIHVDGQIRSLGRFDDAFDAASAYDNAAKKYLDRPILNFTSSGKLNPMRLAERAVSSRSGQSNATPATPQAWSAPQAAVAAGLGDAQERYKGVRAVRWGSHSGPRTKWAASLSVGKRLKKYLGVHMTPEAAAYAHDQAARRYLVSPVVNFLGDGSLNPDRLKTTTDSRLRPEVEEEVNNMVQKKGKTQERQQHGEVSAKHAKQPSAVVTCPAVGKGDPGEAGGEQTEDEVIVVEGSEDEEEEEDSEESSADGRGGVQEAMGMEVGALEDEDGEGGEEEGGSDTESSADGGTRAENASMEVEGVHGPSDEGDECGDEEEEEEEDSDESEEEEEEEGESSEEGEGMEVDGAQDEDDETGDDEEGPGEDEERHRAGGEASSQLSVVIKQEQPDSPLHDGPAAATAHTTSPSPSASRDGSESRRAEEFGRSSSAITGRPAIQEVWVELKTAVFRKLMSVDGPALSEDEACKYRKLSYMLNKPTASLRGFVEEVVLRSGFSAEVADRAAGLLADLVAKGQFDE